MLKKLLSWFTSDKAPAKKPPAKTASPPKRKIESTRIGELGEYKINIQLDQLPKECKYLSDIMVKNSKSRSGYSQIDHVVISPYGLFVIETKNYNGEIKGGRSDRNWRVSNRFNMYNPLMQNYGHIKALENVLRVFPALTYISIVSFTMRCRFSIDPELRKIASDELIVYDTELSEFINRKISRIRAMSDKPLLTEPEINQIYDAVQSANITDAALRAEHNQKAKLQSSK
ncbi:NERD domain-containing protein [Paenibacillus sp. sptzw28]|uniref:nuclease-related domain-containing protein n=1 Tax=Paenibacillus sp. sptzw28 TaxID=715179 RepID=UPI001C6EBB58|nr:nuclease-related domain-containing protein [Paenibacillus sp. sptzw28]QYR20977.1 NERD domain-containing protein [Paenibacillus sp. sptzw28]